MSSWVLIEGSRDVDSTIAFSRDVGISSLELSPGIEKFNDGFSVEFGDKVICPSGGLSVHVGKSYLSWRLDVEGVSLLVPTPLIVNEGTKGVIQDEGAVLLSLIHI